MKLRQIELSLPAGSVWLGAHMAHAPDVRALVILAQTAAGKHLNSREAYVAKHLQTAGFATLLLDLLTPHEESRDPDLRYNTPLLATRLESALEWVEHQPPLMGLSRGLMTSGTGSGAAIRAASRTDEKFDALFCRAGRLDLAGVGPLANVTMPLCVAVGRQDRGREMIRRAYDHVRAEKQWEDVPGADDAFTQPGALERVTRIAAEWFDRTLPPSSPPPADEPSAGSVTDGASKPL
ncbi:alpha/beta hydrolase [Nitrogeniibacter mangrovi]|uniref:Alpha/beta hydrolase n=1 Tax=Nitrogeniibacter mangrovi TaxID=2016596 RepID=A0A6C1B2F0_9RHOO|nr:alpha/beta hydrolase [Nitrogeniibacter mangrovi]QID17816.1 alpha/beta hydrolase [Nitrogeniibacter mangrovi]